MSRMDFHNLVDTKSREFLADPTIRLRSFQWLSSLSKSLLLQLNGLSQPKRERLLLLKEKGIYSFSRVAVECFLEVIERGEFSLIKKDPLPDGPVVIFITAGGGESPVYGETLGLKLRGQTSMNPPLGVYQIASFLDLLGAETHVFNLSIGRGEWEEFKEKVNSNASRLFFVSFTSRHLGKEDLDTVFMIAETLDGLKERGYRPRFVAGGMGAFFNYKTYLKHTPIEIIIRRYGVPDFADMIFDSGYKGPEDTRSNMEIFGDIPNLYIKVQKGDRAQIHATREVPLTDAQRRVIAKSFDIKKVPYTKKYWPLSPAIDICSPDELNIAVKCSTSTSTRARPNSLHPANLVFRPKSIKLLASFGNCPRRCKFCHYSNYDQNLYICPAIDTAELLNTAVQTYPEVRMVIFADDDFLLKRKNLSELLTLLRSNTATRRLVYVIETFPTLINQTILKGLKEVGFRAVMLGLESPVFRVLKDIGKVRSKNSFPKFLSAPKMAYHAGFFTKVTAILFYPIISEEELAFTIDELTRLIDCGISVILFPYIVALSGTRFQSEIENYKILSEKYALPDESELSLPGVVLPNDRVIRQIASQATSAAETYIKSVLESHHISGDYPAGINVLSFFKTIIDCWKEIPGKKISEDTLKELKQHVEGALSRQILNYKIGLSIKEAISLAPVYLSKAKGLIEMELKRGHLDQVAFYLRMYIDFGEDTEIVAATKLVKILAEHGYSHSNLIDSLSYRCLHPLEEVAYASQEALSCLNEASGRKAA